MAASPSPTPLPDLSTALAAVVAGAAPGIVSLGAHRHHASGFVWRSGLLVTADEALPEEDTFTVTLPGGDTAEAKPVGRDPTTDVALLSVDRSDLAPVALAPTTVAAGAVAVVVGAAEGAPTAALGIVSRAGGPWRSLRGGDIDARVELDVRLRGGSEGGVAFDAAGHAIGMAVFGPRRRVLVIPAATIERVATALHDHGRVPRGYLGLGLQPVDVEGREHSGAMVVSVDPQGPGAAAGIHQGDVIVAWNGEPLHHMRALLQALGADSVGKTVTLGLRRAGTDHQVSLTIGERPAH